MSGKRKRQNKNSVASSSSSSKKCKLTGTSQPTDQTSRVYSLSNNKDSYLASTQRWRELLLNLEARGGPLSKSERLKTRVFRKNVNALLNGIDKCARNPAEWPRKKTDFCCNKIISIIARLRKQLLKENTNEKASLTQSNEENTCDLINNRFNLLTSVYYELSTVMKFSEAQRKAINCRVKALNDARIELAKRGQFSSSQSSVTTQLKSNDPELSEARKQPDECREEPTKTQDGLKEAHLNFRESSLETELSNSENPEQNEGRQQAGVCLDNLKPPQDCSKDKIKSRVILRVDPQKILDVCLQEQEKQLTELKDELDWAAARQKETEGELRETREQLQSFVAKNREMAQTKQREVNRKLSEIETSLLMKNPNYRPSSQIENENLNKEEKIFKNIKAIIEYERNSAKSDNNREQNTTKSASETNRSSSLRVSEYEVHLVTLIAGILKVTPFPVSSQTIHSYVVKIDNVVDLPFVESLLRKFPSFFKEVAGVPGSMEKYWIYVDLKPVITI